MKQKDKQYESWLSEIKANQPVLKNPEELTADILNKIAAISPKKSQRKFLIGAWMSGVTAILLLLLLINDTCYPPPSPLAEKQTEYENWSSSIPLPDNWKEMRFTEKNIYLSSRYTQHRKLREIQISQITNNNRLK